MQLVSRALSLFLLMMAVAVGMHYIITPLYDDGSTGFPVWNILNWPMAVAVVAAFLTNLSNWLRRLSESAQSTGAIEWLQVNFRFYSSLVLMLWFFNNWFAELMGVDHAIRWAFVNALFVAVMLSTGVHPWYGQRQR